MLSSTYYYAIVNRNTSGRKLIKTCIKLIRIVQKITFTVRVAYTYYGAYDTL